MDNGRNKAIERVSETPTRPRTCSPTSQTYLEDPVGRMTITEEEDEEEQEEEEGASRGWLTAASGGSKQLPIRRVE